jgi:sterol desaturase/sphingolipid hydroxylase (fatty acid hydroxylase superfamily)
METGWSSLLLGHEGPLRLAAFGLIFLGMATWEVFQPRRARSRKRGSRWPSNLGVAVLDTLLVRILAPSGAVGFAIAAEHLGLGLLPRLGVGLPAALAISVAALDLAVYGQHRVFHAVPVLWRLHRMHHTDVDLDVTSGARFHPLEILLSLGVKGAVVFLLGTPPVAVLLFEVLLNATAMFNHSNVRIPVPVDRVVRWLLVTPDMHRVHHSVVMRETDSNFGFNLPWWDRLFRTYRAQPEAGHDGMRLGLEEFRDAPESRLDRLLTQPFRDDPHRFPPPRD